MVVSDKQPRGSKMKGDPQVIDFLNSALKNELTAINQYWLHYRLLDHWGVQKLAEFERHESIDEMKHADWLSERILLLDGLPNFQLLGRLRIGETVEEVLKADLELVVGASLDPEMGPVVLFGTGGVDIELMKDVALAGAPLDAAGARALIGQTKAGVKLRGYRGKPVLHEPSVIKAIVGLSNLMADAGTRIASIDVNPFLINAKTGVAVDGLIVLNNAAAKRASPH